MKAFSSFGALAVELVSREAAIYGALHESLERIARRIERTAQSELGHYQPEVGPFPAWPELADSTKEERYHLGFTPNDPLLRSGALQESIEHQVEGLEALIGTPNPEAAYLEFGTSRMPARPFMGPAGFRNKETIQKLVGAAAVLGFVGDERIHGALGYDFETKD